MTPEPRRKDRSKPTEKPAGLEPMEETAPPPEEYTTYRETDADEPTSDAAEREADLQPGGAGEETTRRQGRT